VAGDGPVVGLQDVDLDAAFEVFLEVRRDPRVQLRRQPRRPWRSWKPLVWI
jgi:hypothetical protein